MNTALDSPSKRIETSTSRTAEMTCLSRAASSFETKWYYHSDDSIAVKMIPAGLVPVLHTRIGRAIFRRCAKTGMYEYVIARTKYIDAAFEQALEDGFDEIVIFGAGFDTRALRFNTTLQRTQVYELDAPITQAAKIERYRQRALLVPSNLTFVAIDFDKESIVERLARAGFQSGERTLFILEGVLMYLLPASIEATFQTLDTLGGHGSRVVFDYVRASVLREENTLYGEKGTTQSVSKVQEEWVFGFEPSEVSGFVARFGFSVSDHVDASELEHRYFRGENGEVLARVNGTHGIVTAKRV